MQVSERASRAEAVAAETRAEAQRQLVAWEDRLGNSVRSVLQSRLGAEIHAEVAESLHLALTETLQARPQRPPVACPITP